MNLKSGNNRLNSLLLPAVLFLGMVAGAMLLLIIGANSGMIAFTAVEDKPLSESATPATDYLNNYQCRKAETRLILTGGIEDNYSTAEMEPINMTAAQLTAIRSPISTGRLYDEPGLDKRYIDRFDFEGTVAHGVFVVKAKSVSSFENDYLTVAIHDFSDETDNSSVSFAIANLNQYSALKRENGFFFGNLKDLEREQDGQKILDLAQSMDRAKFFKIHILDDYQVDFAGVTLCLEPEEAKGLTFGFNAQKRIESLTYLSCKLNDKEECDYYGGDSYCHIERPVACFDPKFQKVPEILPKDKHRIWVGGEVSFSDPVQGRIFKTADDVHNFCSKQFGDNWRVLSIGDLPSTYEGYLFGDPDFVGQAWINSGDQPYANCWDIRSDYREVQR